MTRALIITPGAGLQSLSLTDQQLPGPGHRQVLVRMRAASLNYRDLLIIDGAYPGSAPGQLVPLSDGAGEVVATGPGSSRFAVGDRVAGIFMQGWVAGEMTPSHAGTALGGAIGGVLAEHRLFDEDGLVRIPDHLSFEEAATLPCAAVTAWNALYGLYPLRPGQTVLTLGTGGVAIFALQLAHAAGAKVIITSSSDEKLARARDLGADFTINYATTPEWGAEVLRLTAGAGVDVVVETGGPGTLAQSIAATRRGGAVQLVGVLSLGTIDPLPILTGGVVVRGLMVGSGEMFEAMNRAITAAQIRPIVDRVFDFGEARQAYEYLKAATHLGKVVIRIDG